MQSGTQEPMSVAPAMYEAQPWLRTSSVRVRSRPVQDVKMSTAHAATMSPRSLVPSDHSPSFQQQLHEPPTDDPTLPPSSGSSRHRRQVSLPHLTGLSAGQGRRVTSRDTSLAASPLAVGKESPRAAAACSRAAQPGSAGRATAATTTPREARSSSATAADAASDAAHVFSPSHIFKQFKLIRGNMMDRLQLESTSPSRENSMCRRIEEAEGLSPNGSQGSSSSSESDYSCPQCTDSDDGAHEEHRVPAAHAVAYGPLAPPCIGPVPPAGASRLGPRGPSGLGLGQGLGQLHDPEGGCVVGLHYLTEDDLLAAACAAQQEARRTTSTGGSGHQEPALPPMLPASRSPRHCRVGSEETHTLVVQDSLVRWQGSDTMHMVGEQDPFVKPGSASDKEYDGPTAGQHAAAHLYAWHEGAERPTAGMDDVSLCLQARQPVHSQVGSTINAAGSGSLEASDSSAMAEGRPGRIVPPPPPLDLSFPTTLSPLPRSGRSGLGEDVAPALQDPEQCSTPSTPRLLASGRNTPRAAAGSVSLAAALLSPTRQPQAGAMSPTRPTTAVGGGLRVLHQSSSFRSAMQSTVQAMLDQNVSFVAMPASAHEAMCAAASMGRHARAYQLLQSECVAFPGNGSGRALSLSKLLQRRSPAAQAAAEAIAQLLDGEEELHIMGEAEHRRLLLAAQCGSPHLANMLCAALPAPPMSPLLLQPVPQQKSPLAPHATQPAGDTSAAATATLIPPAALSSDPKGQHQGRWPGSTPGPAKASAFGCLSCFALPRRQSAGGSSTLQREGSSGSSFSLDITASESCVLRQQQQQQGPSVAAMAGSSEAAAAAHPATLDGNLEAAAGLGQDSKHITSPGRERPSRAPMPRASTSDPGAEPPPRPPVALTPQVALRQLLQAAQYGNAARVAALLHAPGHGWVDVNATEGGTLRTALHYAAEAGCWQVAHILVHAGAFTSVRDSSGHTPVDLARRKRHASLCCLIKEAERRRQLSAMLAAKVACGK